MKTIKNKHIGAYGVIIKDNKIALIKKALGGYTGKFDLPGGGMEHNELPHETLKREIMEEAGFEVTKYDLIDVIATNIKWKMDEDIEEDLHHIGILYKVNVKGNIKHEPDGIDSNGCDWHEISKLKKNELTPFTIYALEKLGYKLSS